MHKVTIAAIAMVWFAGVAHAENSACWGDASRQDITCTKITEQLLLSLRGQSMEFVRKAMKAPGVERRANGLHFLSNYDRGRTTGGGDVNVMFEDGRAILVEGSVDSPAKIGEFEFIWNAYATPPLGEEFDHSTKNFARQPFCSDFSGRPARCKGRNIDDELTLLQMQGGLTKAELLLMLEASCRQGIAVSDPAGDCARLRNRLR